MVGTVAAEFTESDLPSARQPPRHVQWHQADEGPSLHTQSPHSSHTCLQAILPHTSPGTAVPSASFSAQRSTTGPRGASSRTF